MEGTFCGIILLWDRDEFAFVDTDGVIYTSTGTQSDIEKYAFDRNTISGPEISIKNLKSPNKKVIIATPIDHRPFEGHELINLIDALANAEYEKGYSYEKLRLI